MQLSIHQKKRIKHAVIFAAL
ncbi:MAG: hypothetical protein CI947_929, partial [Halanaerobium sp.]